MKKTLKIFLCMILALCIMVPVMAANENITSSLSASKTEVKKGEEITVTLQLNNIPSSNTKALEGKISFDSSKLELQKNENLNSWITTLSTDGTGMASYKTGASSANEQTLKLTFKVKEDAKAGETTISVKNLQMALEEGNGEAGSEISVTESNVKITIADSNQNNGGNNNGGSNNGDNNNGNNNGGSNNGNNNGKNGNVKDATVSNKEQHAKTGVVKSALPVVITILATASAIVYFKYKKLDI